MEERRGTQQGTTEQGAMMRCPLCGAEFPTQTELEQHRRQAHPNK